MKPSVAVFRYVPCALLIGVASLQIVLASTQNLSPWMGGGFGMFSSTDELFNRYLTATLVGPNGSRIVEVPESHWETANAVLALPMDKRLQDFGQDLLSSVGEESVSYDAIELEVWTVRYAASDLTPSGELLRRARVETHGR